MELSISTITSVSHLNLKEIDLPKLYDLLQTDKNIIFIELGNKYKGLILTFLIFLCINGSIQEIPYQFMFVLLSAQLLTEVKKKSYIYENY